MVGLDGCEVRLCGLCAFVRPRVPCVPCVSRLPPVSFYRYTSKLANQQKRTRVWNDGWLSRLAGCEGCARAAILNGVGPSSFDHGRNRCGRWSSCRRRRRAASRHTGRVPADQAPCRLLVGAACQQLLCDALAQQQCASGHEATVVVASSATSDLDNSEQLARTPIVVSPRALRSGAR